MDWTRRPRCDETPEWATLKRLLGRPVALERFIERDIRGHTRRVGHDRCAPGADGGPLVARAHAGPPENEGASGIVRGRAEMRAERLSRCGIVSCRQARKAFQDERVGRLGSACRQRSFDGCPGALKCHVRRRFQGLAGRVRTDVRHELTDNLAFEHDRRINLRRRCNGRLRSRRTLPRQNRDIAKQFPQRIAARSN
jgi:hypothetical protein